MKITDHKSCCAATSDDDKKPAAHIKEHITGRYILYAIPLLIIWGLIYQRLSDFSRVITYLVLRLPEGNHLSSAVEFFLFETPKVLMLLTLVVFGVGIVRSFFTPEKTRAILAGKRESIGNVLAAFLGIVTPFCSCSAVPLFIGFVTTGVPLGVTFSFLIAAPMVNEIAIVLLYGLFGFKIAAIYLITGLLIAMIAGWIIGKLHMERHLEDWVLQIQAGENQMAEEKLKWADRVQ